MSNEVQKVERDQSTQVASVNPMQLVSMAVESGADIDKLSKLMDLQERWEAKEAKKSFFDAMANFQRNCPDIYKTKKAHNSLYTPLGDIMAIIRDVLADCGLSIRFEQDHTQGVKITCIVTHRDGHNEKTSMSAPADTSGSKNAIQAIASTVTYLQRYTLISALGITTADADMDGRLPQKAAPQIVDVESVIMGLVKQQGRTDAQFFQWVSKQAKREVLSFDDMSEEEKQQVAIKLGAKA